MRKPSLPLVFCITAVVTVLVQLGGARNAGAPTASPFSDIGAGLTGVHHSAVAWGDYDSDGDLDALVTGTGSYSPPSPASTVYRNDGASGFTPIAAGLTGIYDGSVAWGDYDRDGDLDILLAGDTSTNPPVIAPVSQIYRNTGGSFSEDTTADAALADVTQSSVAWGDYDSDGDLDILLTGLGTSGYASEIYRNDGGVFHGIGAGLSAAGYGQSVWGDYDKDGDLDVLLTGFTGGESIAEIYENSSGIFTKDTAASAGLNGVSQGAAVWGDYDSDGDLDILLAGYTGSGYISEVYKNDGSGGFSGIGAGASLAAFDYGDAAWGDYDSDGDLDIALTGILHPSGSVSEVYQNLGSDSFAALGAGLTPAEYSSIAWGDYNADGKLDILLAGYDGGGGMAKIYGNSIATANTRPSAPGGLKETSAGSKATLSWNAASDGQTPAAGLSYNLRVGTTPGGSDVVSPMASSEGVRRLPAIGNAGEHTGYALNNLPSGTYYWSVQAIDSSFAGSTFAAEQSFTVPPTFVFSSAVYSVGEAGPSALITIKRSGASAGTDSVHFATANGNATAGSDYAAVSQDVPFSHDQSEKTVYVPITNDAQVEEDETVLLSLTNLSTDTAVGNPSSATLTITDNDRAFAFSSAGYSVGEGAGLAQITIARNGLSSGVDTVHLATANGTAKAGPDYTAVSQAVSFAVGETQKTVSVPIKNDKLHEKNETVKLSLSSPSPGATLGSPNTATLTINDNDKPGRIASAKLVLGKKKVTKLKRSQAKKVKLTVKFKPQSKKFNYVLTIRKNGKWRKVKTVKRTGDFAGTRKMTVKSLFRGKAVKKGRYRIRLSADANSRTLTFRVT